MKSAVASISACKPDILVVERNVAGFAVRALENEGITLVYNVTAENLQKLAINLDSQVMWLMELNKVHLFLFVSADNIEKYIASHQA